MALFTNVFLKYLIKFKYNNIIHKKKIPLKVLKFFLDS